MPEQKNRTIAPYEDKGGFLKDIVNRIKLIMRLMGDSRVSPFLKLIPLGSLFYFIFPDIAPGPIDDAAIIWLGSYLFVELCPPDVVEEHLAELSHTVSGQWRDPLGEASMEMDEEVIEAEYREAR
jgi:hypothetical protein